MIPISSSTIPPKTDILPAGKCQQCGAADKKLSRCAQCRIALYCNRDCQQAAWHKHKLVCHDTSKKQDSISGNIIDIAEWCGKKFGDLRGVRIIDKDIRILSHTGGFAVFLPKEVWRYLDYQVPLSFSEKKDSSCWIADKEFAFVKVDVIPSELDESIKDYASEDLEVALNKIESFVKKNLFENMQAYPDSSYFTHGSFNDFPDMPRPYRWRLGGNFKLQY